jgi:hypothetical protein
MALSVKTSELDFTGSQSENGRNTENPDWYSW